MKRILKKIYWVLSAQFGIDPRKMFSFLRGIPRYMFDLFRFNAKYNGRLDLVPCLNDWYEEGGTTKDEYFLQDLLIAKKIFESKPKKHVDVGSRVDGFVAHVASFRDIEVFDVRPVTTQIPGITFKQADLMKPIEGLVGYCDSLSCLHALEHFGLGRYGDPIDPKGYECGFANMANLLRKGGVFYLSVPIGIGRVEFNANRVLDPREVINLAIKNNLRLSGFTVIRQGGKVELFDLEDLQLDLLAGKNYALGIFTFERIS